MELHACKDPFLTSLSENLCSCPGDRPHVLQGLLGGAGGPSGECGARLTRLAAPLASAAPAQSGPAPRGSAGCGGTAAATSTPCRRGNCDDASARSTRSTCRWSLSGAYPAPSPVPPRARPPERPGAASGTHAEHATALACCAARVEPRRRRRLRHQKTPGGERELELGLGRWTVWRSRLGRKSQTQP